jgi:hypothetical protein
VTPVLAKPAHGAPCNSCGRCCAVQLCPLGEVVFGYAEGPCPALSPAAGGALVCGLMLEPGRWAPGRALRRGRAVLARAAAILCGAGHGCDMAAPGEPRSDVMVRFASHAVRSHAEIRRAAQAWGVVDKLRD